MGVQLSAGKFLKENQNEKIDISSIFYTYGNSTNKNDFEKTHAANVIESSALEIEDNKINLLTANPNRSWKQIKFSESLSSYGYDIDSETNFLLKRRSEPLEKKEILAKNTGSAKTYYIKYESGFIYYKSSSNTTWTSFSSNRDLLFIGLCGGGGGGYTASGSGFGGGGAGGSAIVILDMKKIADNGCYLKVEIGKGGDVGKDGGDSTISLYNNNTTTFFTAYGGKAGAVKSAGEGRQELYY